MAVNHDAHHVVVALSMPIVYTNDGDHDRDGLLFAPACHVPLLRWARDRFEDEDEEFARRVTLVAHLEAMVDGLPHFADMLERLEALAGYDPTDHDPADDRLALRQMARDLLATVADRWGRRVAMIDPVDAAHGGGDERGDDGGGHDDPVHDSIRHHVLHQLDELRAAWRMLLRTHPEIDAAVLPELGSDHYHALVDAQTKLLSEARQAVKDWLDELDEDPVRGLDANLVRLQAESGLSAGRIRRLLLNDHRAGPPVVAEPGRPAPAVGYDRFNPMRPIPVVEPLVLRGHAGEQLTVKVENQLRRRRVGFHVQGGGLGGGEGDQAGVGVRYGDGSHVGDNPDTTIGPGEHHLFRLDCHQEGVWAINDLADVRGSEHGTNARGLFGALIVEPAGSTWLDPETGEDLTHRGEGPQQYRDVIVADERPGTEDHLEFTDFHVDDVARSFREHTVFIHDEPSVHSLRHLVGEHAVMPLSYRAEPMPNRIPHALRRLAEQTRDREADGGPPADGIDFRAVRRSLDPDTFEERFDTARGADGTYLERIGGEEQHHSSWLFGEPVTPVLRGYRGDPSRIRLVHAGVKETHVFHLHVHQWRAVANDTAPPSTHGAGKAGSQILDSITIGPQAAITIDPLYGAGSRQHAFGDIIWHCHLYPHFHHGMWGLWRSFDRLVDHDTVYPDGSPCRALRPLPGRDPAPADDDHPGFPWFVDATFPRKSPPPPALDDAHVGGRRRLLGMDPISDLERNACPPGAVDRHQPGAVFVDLDGLAVEWNERAGLPPPRIISYDISARAERADYNRHGWHDPLACTYRLTGVRTRQLDEHGEATGEEVDHPVDHLAWDPGRPETFFPRANQGDIVEIRFANEFTSLPADRFDVAQPAVECGLHVHLVKFDVLSADGSSTGFNYLSGASTTEAMSDLLAAPDDDHGPDRVAANVGLHRWVVDEEFGPSFFHDHLLANYRQKHGLAGALVAEPAGSTWLTPDGAHVAWSGTEAVVIPTTEPDGPGGDRYRARFREHALSVCDFVAVLDEDGRPLNPPGVLSGDNDPGTMAVNYRCEPLTRRGPDPSLWFAAESDPPDTPMWRGYPGERAMVRLIQGSHEEQHTFTVNGMRWRRDWNSPVAPLANQQTVGISEAFTLNVDPATGGRYGPGDHLWQCASIDDTWLGCWGWWRIHDEAHDDLPGLAHYVVPCDDRPDPALIEAGAAAAVRDRLVRPDHPDREFVVVARRVEHRYDGFHLTDPWGLSFAVADGWEPVPDPHDPDGHQADDHGDLGPEFRRGLGVGDGTEPLVLRARRGEWVKVTVINELVRPHPDDEPDLPPFGVEPSAPRLPLEHTDELGRPDQRTVSPRVSLHPSLVRYEVGSDDGAYVGDNDDGTVPPLPATGADGHGGHEPDVGQVVDRPGGHGNWREYWWYADEALAPEHHASGDPGQVCYLQDLADLRNHRHHGLFGALVVEPGDVTPIDLVTGLEAWSGPTARIVDTASWRNGSSEVVATEHVVFVHDGVRLFVAGDPAQPVGDIEPDGDPEDAGHKGINYRCNPVHPAEGLSDPDPSTPSFASTVYRPTWLRVVGAADKPRQHTFNVHGVDLDSAPWVDGAPKVGALSGIAAGWVADLVLRPEAAGDHVYRSGACQWALQQGAWGLLRVEG
ncbi:MAG: multicopper oxidase domain-containing protein [Acidimicrobiales bacterium]